MPFALVTVGILLFVTAINDTWRQAGAQVYKDLFSESGGFVYWAAGLVIVGLIGYIPSLKRPSDLFMVLVILAMLLQNKGFFGELQQGLQNGASGSTGNAAPSTSPLSLSGLGLNVATNGTEPLTTPSPAPAGSSVPLGFGGIGAA